MKKLKLIQGLSYAVRGFSCVKGVPFNIEDNIAERLLSTGRFEELQSVSADNNEIEDDVEPDWNDTLTNRNDVKPDWNDSMTNRNDVKPDWNDTEKADAAPNHEGVSLPIERELSADAIAKLKKAELEALAAERNIDISDCNNNNERAGRICGMLGLASTVQMGLED